MNKSFDLRLVEFSISSVALVCLAFTYFYLSNYRSNLSVESIVEAKATSTPTAVPISDFRPDGGFGLNSKPPKAFQDIEWLSIITGTAVGYGCAPQPCSTPPIEKRENWRAQIPHGLLVTKNYNYSWKSENLSVKKFSFVTESYKSQSYQFAGHFNLSGNYEDTKPKDAILVGRLTKMINGKIVAEEEIDFVWFSWGEVDNQTYSRKKPK